MTNSTLPPVLETILTTNSEPDAVFCALLPALGDLLKGDRCFLYLRDPKTRLGKTPYCWRHPQYPEILDADWQEESEALPQEDPLFAAALRAEPSIFVEDVETASPDVVNREFERKNFGHRALIHAHLCQEGQLWGILQPCVFGQPRVWTQGDHVVMNQVTTKITPLAVRYVQEALS